MKSRSITAVASTLSIAAVMTGCSTEKPSEEEAREEVSRRSSNPETAQFRNVGQHNKTSYCGEFNSKKPDGTETGFSKFYANKANGQWEVFIDSEGGELAAENCR